MPMAYPLTSRQPCRHFLQRSWLYIAITILVSLTAYSQDTAAIERLIINLRSNDYLTSVRAREALVNAKDERVIGMLIVLLQNDNDERIRGEAARILGDIKNPVAVKPLIEKLKDTEETESVRTSVAEALGALGDSRAFESLLAALSENNLSVACAAAEAMGQLGDRRAIDPLLRELTSHHSRERSTPYQDPDSIKVSVIKGLGPFKEPRAIEALVGFLGVNNRVVRDEATWALQQMGEPAIETLIRMLQNDNWEVRKRAARILDELGWSFTNRTEQLYYLAASQNFSALVQIGNEATYVLLDLLKADEPKVRQGAAEALGQIGDKRAINALLNNLSDWATNQAAANALYFLGWLPESDEDKVHVLVAMRKGEELADSWDRTREILMKDMLSDDEWKIENAVNAFIGIGEQNIIPALKELLDKKGSKAIAESYLNCGNRELEIAGTIWAKQHGYTFVPGASSFPRWGLLR